jgi:hypothetical protein
MATPIKGLKAIKEAQEAREARAAGSEDFVSVDWLSLKDGDSVKVIFPQEVDESNKNYSSKNGVLVQAVEHSNPDNFKRKALCTAEDGACWACEKRATDGQRVGPDGKVQQRWKQVTRLYTNVLVETGKDTYEVKVLSQGVGDKSITPALVEQAVELDTITDKFFKIKRTGAGFSNTSYLLTPLGEHKVNVEDYDLFDIEKDVLRNIPYEKQEAHYMGGQSADPHAGEEKPKADSPADEW